MISSVRNELLDPSQFERRFGGLLSPEVRDAVLEAIAIYKEEEENGFWYHPSAGERIDDSGRAKLMMRRMRGGPEKI